MVMHSMEPGYEPKDSIMQTVREMSDGETVVFVCHPGYLDRFILENSSLTTDRTKEVDALIDLSCALGSGLNLIFAWSTIATCSDPCHHKGDRHLCGGSGAVAILAAAPFCPCGAVECSRLKFASIEELL